MRKRIGLTAVAAALGLVFVAAGTTTPPPGTTRIKLSVAAFPDYPISAFGAVWVESHRGYGIYRINPRTNRTKWIPMPENQCGPPAHGAGRLWFSNCFGETGVARTYGLNPTTGKIVARRSGAAVAYAGGSLWTVDEGKNTLVRSDPRTGVVLARIKLGISPAPNGQWAGFECFGSLWTPNGTDGLQRTELATNATRVIPLPGGHDASGNGYFAVNNVACAAGKVWVPDGAGLYEVDPAIDAATLSPIPIGPFSQQGDVSIVSAGDDVYLRTSDTSVAKIDATTGAVVSRYPATGGGGGIIVAYGSLWVVNANAGSLWREPL